MLGESRRQAACPAASKAPVRTMAATSYWRMWANLT